jgi:plasmid segregation protein ParM
MSSLPQNSPAAAILVAIDDGHSMTKLVTENNRELKIRTIARQGTMGATEIGTGSGSIRSYEADGQQYTIGLDFAGESTRTNDFQYSPMNRAIVHHALVMAGLGGQSVHLVTGLPFTSYFLGNTENQALISKKELNLSRAVRSLTKQQLARVVSNEVCAEGLAAYFEWAIDDAGRVPYEKLGKTVAVVDIGGRTTDIVVVAGSAIDHARSSTENIGSLNFLDELRVPLAKVVGVELRDLTASVIEDAALRGTIQLKGRSFDVFAEVAQVRAIFEDRIARFTRQQLQQGVGIDKVLLVGGGAVLFPGVARALGEPGWVHVPPKPEFANARGMLKRARARMQSK